MRWPIQFVLLGLIWGGSFMFIKIEVEAGIAPVHVALLRCVFGAVALFAILAVTRDRLPPRDLLLHLTVVAAISSAAPFVLFAQGETEIASLLAGIINATVPLMTLVFSLTLLPDERPTRRRITGLFVGFLGVLVVLAPWDGVGGGTLAGALFCLAAATCYGLSFPYVRRHLSGRPESGVAISAAQVTIAGLMLLPFAPLGALPAEMPGVDAWLSVVALGILGTGVAYVFMFNIIRDAGAQTGSMITYVVPVFAIVLGVLVLGEQVSWHEPVGGAVILGGVAISR